MPLIRMYSLDRASSSQGRLLHIGTKGIRTEASLPSRFFLRCKPRLTMRINFLGHKHRFPPFQSQLGTSEWLQLWGRKGTKGALGCLCVVQCSSDRLGGWVRRPGWGVVSLNVTPGHALPRERLA